MPTSPTTLDSVGLPLGSAAVDFQLKGVDDKTHKLNSFADRKALVVVFSCNHCPYVQAYEDRMIQLQKDYSGNRQKIWRNLHATRLCVRSAAPTSIQGQNR